MNRILPPRPFLDTILVRVLILFLANLGHSFRRIALVICVECLVLEVGLRLAVA